MPARAGRSGAPAAATRQRGPLLALRAPRRQPLPRAPRWHSRVPARDTLLPAAAQPPANGTADAGDAVEAVVSVASGADAKQQLQQQGAEATPMPASHPLALPDDPFAAEELVAELADPSALGKRGEIFTAAQVLAVMFVIWPPFRLAGLFDLLATLALTAGLVFCVYGLFSLGRSFSPLASPRKKHRLVTTGLYAHIRHPIYGGMVLAALGLAAITRSEGRLALAILLWFIVEQKAKFEEAALAQRYGEEYAAYKKATSWKLLPCY